MIHALQRDVSMRVFRVVVDDRHPFQLGVKIPFHPSHQLPRVTRKVDPVPELGRNDDFEEPLIARSLPCVESLGNVNTRL
jgi:hypothetical protein